MRVKRGHHKVQRRAKLLKLASGYYGAKKHLYRAMREQVHRSLAFAYSGRKQKKRDFRSLWIIRINAACNSHGLSYSRFIAGLKAASIAVDRKVLSELAVSEPKTFESLVTSVKKALKE